MSGKVLRFLVAGLTILFLAEIAGRGLIAASDAPALRWHDHSAELKIQQMDDLERVETVIVGTSMAQQALVPQYLASEFGDSYNAGLNGGVPVVAEQWLRADVLTRLRPTRVIWGLGPLDLSAVYGDATLDAYETALATKDGLPATAERGTAAISVLVRNRTVLRDPSELLGQKATARRNGRTAAREATGDRGERIEFQTAISPARAAEVRGRLTPFALDRDDLAAIARSVAQLKADGVEVVFVQLPVPQRFIDLYPGGPEQDDLVGAALEALAIELDVRLVTVTGTYTNNDFVDYTHLNEAAAERFSRETAAAL